MNDYPVDNYEMTDDEIDGYVRVFSRHYKKKPRKVKKKARKPWGSIGFGNFIERAYVRKDEK